MKTDTFGDWLGAQTPAALCKILEIRPETIKNWFTGKTFPTIRHMRKIRKLSEGRITYEMIIDRAGRPWPDYTVVQ